ncbi:MAG: hypothetical protein AAGB02_07625 [Pseudomonadota bacterium]
MKHLTVYALIALTATGVSPVLAKDEDNKNKKERAAGPLAQSDRLLGLARKQQAEKGCAAATPTYRVIASFGDGYEVAQYELGACLFEMESEHTMETRLFKKEAAFWLERAAYAGNARAQGMLAELLSGVEPAPGFPTDPVAAMGWTLIYESNAEHTLYGLKDTAPAVRAHLETSLTEDEKRQAQAFAAGFDEFTMESFTPPAPPKGARQQRNFQRFQNGERPRRRADG